jgi:hypothetical protein
MQQHFSVAGNDAIHDGWICSICVPQFLIIIVRLSPRMRQQRAAPISVLSPPGQGSDLRYQCASLHCLKRSFVLRASTLSFAREGTAA